VARHEQVDIIYSNSTKSHLYGALVRLLTNKKAIWHIRDNFKKSILSGFLSKNSDTILCVANHLAEKITTREKRVIHGGVNITEWNLPIPDEQNRKQSSKSFEDIIVIAQVAQLTPWKNHLALIEAASILVKEFTNIVFLLIGDDLSNRGNAYKNQLRKKIDELDLSNYFSFVGHRNDIKDVLAQVDILIHPAIGEPFGRVLVEAMALEKPVVAVNSGGPSEIVLDGVTGFLVDPKNLVRGLAQKTRILLKNKDLRIEMGKAGRQRVVSEFSLEKHVEQMEAVFYDISQE
jgi:glycosyltransferase involved in cell wall biosynthesis